YKGGLISGSPETATANIWTWNNTNGRGYEIKPDGATTTLFLPASGNRSGNGLLYSQGSGGLYWSVSVAGTYAYYLYISSDLVIPADSSYGRSSGFTLRCIK
ncbi:hypothetical protein, partial [Enterobacter roggenkampii]|uniref:hypothetical protein n=1 Tax=Enterobacter roggenkampii TaxID=1812935 RepID=UPI0021D3A0D6